MENIQNLPKHQQQQLEQHLVNSQVKDSLTWVLNMWEILCVPSLQQELHDFNTINTTRYNTMIIFYSLSRIIIYVDSFISI